jgi:hypothetical protein
VVLPLCANVGSGSNFMAMNGDNPRAERGVCKNAGELRRTTGVEVGRAKGLNEMDKSNTKKVPKNEVFYVNAADLADKNIVLTRHGLDPLLLSTSTWALVQASQCQAIN